MNVFTIGFTRTNAARFFGALREAGIQQLLDVRLKNSSQLAGFSRHDDLPFFLEELCRATYMHMPILAPSAELLSDYRARRIGWLDYERRFGDLLKQRQIDSTLDPSLFEPRTVLLCTEPAADHCHRRLVLEYLQQQWGGIEIVNL
jgi:uncharacterized protein (DUF488 family)